MSGEEQRSYLFPVEEEDAGERIDRYLTAKLSEDLTISRNHVQNLIKNGDVLCNGRIVRPSLITSAGDSISVLLPKSLTPDILPENIPLDIIYEDDELMVINKPRGMVVHPAAGHFTGTVVNAVMYHCTDQQTGEIRLSGINGILRPGIVHRIDRDTTGSLIVCKTDRAHQSIAAQIKEHSTLREYTAIVYGRIEEDALTIDKPIGRDVKNRLKMACRKDGKTAVTHVEVLERFDKFTYIRCRLETGRTHQIRVHMASERHPVLFDPLYAEGIKWPLPAQLWISGQCLHAGRLEFVHPSTGERISTYVPEPDDFAAVLDYLRNCSKNP